MIKKLLVLAMAFSMVGFVGCSDDEEDNNTPSVPSQKETTCTVSAKYQCIMIDILGQQAVGSREEICSVENGQVKWEKMERSCASEKCDESTGKCVDVPSCDNGKACPDGLSCSPLMTCLKPKCSEDSECDGMYCVNNFCVHCDSTDHPCADGKTCEKGKCVDKT